MEFEAFQPTNDFVQVKLWEEDHSKIVHGSLGVHVPDRYQQRSNRGIVHGVGEKVTSPVQVGDRIVLGIGNVEDLVVNGESFLLIREGDIRGFERAVLGKCSRGDKHTGPCNGYERVYEDGSKCWVAE